MKYLLLFLVVLTACVKFPVRNENDPESCYDYKLCMYYSAKGDYKSDCKLEFQKCCKDRDYAYCKDEKNRWNDQKEQECWDKKQ